MGSSRNFHPVHLGFHPSSAALLSVDPVKAMGSSINFIQSIFFSSVQCCSSQGDGFIKKFSSRTSWFSSVLSVVVVKPVMMVLLLPALLCCLLLLFLRLPLLLAPNSFDIQVCFSFSVNFIAAGIVGDNEDSAESLHLSCSSCESGKKSTKKKRKKFGGS